MFEVFGPRSDPHETTDLLPLGVWGSSEPVLLVALTPPLWSNTSKVQWRPGLTNRKWWTKAGNTRIQHRSVKTEGGWTNPTQPENPEETVPLDLCAEFYMVLLKKKKVLLGPMVCDGGQLAAARIAD